MTSGFRKMVDSMYSIRRSTAFLAFSEDKSPVHHNFSNIP